MLVINTERRLRSRTVSYAVGGPLNVTKRNDRVSWRVFCPGRSCSSWKLLPFGCGCADSWACRLDQNDVHHSNHSTAPRSRLSSNIKTVFFTFSFNACESCTSVGCGSLLPFTVTFYYNNYNMPDQLPAHVCVYWVVIIVGWNRGLDRATRDSVSKKFGTIENDHWHPAPD